MGFGRVHVVLEDGASDLLGLPPQRQTFHDAGMVGGVGGGYGQMGERPYVPSPAASRDVWISGHAIGQHDGVDGRMHGQEIELSHIDVLMGREVEVLGA